MPQPTGIGQASAKEALSTAFTDRSYILLIFGYFVCGFQVVFIGAHLTPYLLDRGVPAHVGVTALALIGLFNVFGTYLAGVAAGRVPKRHVLALIYFMRSVVIVAFLALPLSPLTVYLFAAAIGFLWLSTVPPTNALVAQIYGARYLGTLGGIVFFSHQIGSFLGAWLGGTLFVRRHRQLRHRLGHHHRARRLRRTRPPADRRARARGAFGMRTGRLGRVAFTRP